MSYFISYYHERPSAHGTAIGGFGHRILENQHPIDFIESKNMLNPEELYVLLFYKRLKDWEECHKLMAIET